MIRIVILWSIEVVLEIWTTIIVFTKLLFFKLLYTLCLFNSHRLQFFFHDFLFDFYIRCIFFIFHQTFNFSWLLWVIDIMRILPFYNLVFDVRFVGLWMLSINRLHILVWLTTLWAWLISFFQVLCIFFTISNFNLNVILR